MLATVQLLVHYPLLILSFPSNASFCFQIVVDLVNFKIIPTEWIMRKLFNIKDYTTNKFGYSDNILVSLGLLVFFFIAFLGFCILLLLAVRITKRSYKI